MINQKEKASREEAFKYSNTRANNSLSRFKKQSLAVYFDRSKLPTPNEYFKAQRIKLTGSGEWRNALCPFHIDTNPSLRIRLETGAFKCMACGAHGGDVLAFHQQLFNLSFKQAAQQLGAWS